MWVRLDDEEIALILDYLPEGQLAEKLSKPIDPHTAVFAAAVKTDNELEVDDDTVISKGENGAFVMSWTWIYNHQAGLPDDDEELDQGSSFQT